MAGGCGAEGEAGKEFEVVYRAGYVSSVPHFIQDADGDVGVFAYFVYFFEAVCLSDFGFFDDVVAEFAGDAFGGGFVCIGRWGVLAAVCPCFVSDCVLAGVRCQFFFLYRLFFRKENPQVLCLKHLRVWKWWRRRELNPCPERRPCRHLHVQTQIAALASAPLCVSLAVRQKPVEISRERGFPAQRQPAEYRSSPQQALGSERGGLIKRPLRILLQNSSHLLF